MFSGAAESCLTQGIACPEAVHREWLITVVTKTWPCWSSMERAVYAAELCQGLAETLSALHLCLAAPSARSGFLPFLHAHMVILHSDPFSVSAFGEPTCNRAHTKLISAGKPRKLFSLQRHLVRQKITTQGIHCWLPQEPTVPQPGQQELYDVSFFSRHLSMK